jgi:hypothetical protein
MFFINHLQPNEWWEWDKEKMIAYNYYGDWHNINENSLGNAEYYECNNWHELCLAKHFCPIEVTLEKRDVWISPEGGFYDGEAHMVTAEYICDIIYGKDLGLDYAEDYLEEFGWIKATTSLMWQIRFEDWHWKKLPQPQYDALWDWCEYHNMPFPDVDIK